VANWATAIKSGDILVFLFSLFSFFLLLFFLIALVLYSKAPTCCSCMRHECAAMSGGILSV
jgi:hypothetical protein